MNGRDLILYARSISPSLGTKEKLVASFIANHYDQLANMTINELADRLNVSQATITKLCKKLNSDGYYSLRKALIKYIEEREEDLPEDFSYSDSPKEILQKVFTNSIVALQDTLSILDDVEFAKALSAFNNAPKHKKVLLFGVGGSGSIADDICHKFLKIGIYSYCYRDTHLQYMSASLLQPGDIVIGISHSGATKAVIEALSIARDAGATTICVTNFIKSPITEVADIKLVSSAKNSPLTGENAAVRIVHLSILDALYTGIVLYDYENAMEKLHKTQNAVLNKRF